MFCFPSSSNRAAELNRSASPAPRSGQPLLHTFTNTHTHQRTKRVVRERLIRNYIRDTVTSLSTNWSCVCSNTNGSSEKAREGDHRVQRAQQKQQRAHNKQRSPRRSGLQLPRAPAQHWILSHTNGGAAAACRRRNNGVPWCRSSRPAS